MNDFTRTMAFFTKNYAIRFSLYNADKINFEQLKNINEHETSLTKILDQRISEFEHEISKKNTYAKAPIKDLQKLSVNYFDALKHFQKRELAFLTHKISLDELKKDLTLYNELKQAIPEDIVKFMLGNLAKSNCGLPPGIMNYFSGMKDMKNTWIGPMVLTGMYDMIYKRLNTVNPQSNEINSSSIDFITLDTIMSLLTIYKMPDYFMKIFYELDHKKAA